MEMYEDVSIYPDLAPMKVTAGMVIAFQARFTSLADEFSDPREQPE